MVWVFLVVLFMCLWVCDVLDFFIRSGFNFWGVWWKYGGELNDEGGVFVSIIFCKFVFNNYCEDLKYWKNIGFDKVVI